MIEKMYNINYLLTLMFRRKQPIRYGVYHHFKLQNFLHRVEWIIKKQVLKNIISKNID